MTDTVQTQPVWNDQLQQRLDYLQLKYETETGFTVGEYNELGSLIKQKDAFQRHTAFLRQKRQYIQLPKNLIRRYPTVKNYI